MGVSSEGLSLPYAESGSSSTAGARSALEVAFAPRAVAVIGASSTPGKFGYKLVEHLLKGGFGGRVYPVNPRGESVHGLSAYPSLAAVPDVIDVAAIVVPADKSLAAVRECAERGVRVGVLIASGFAETSAAGSALQDEIVAAARRTGMRLIGPNCEGFINFRQRVLLSFSMMFLGLTPGPISLVSQSGAYCGIVASRLSRAGIGPAKVVSSGNEADLATVDFLEYLGDDPDTRVIMLHIEGLRQPPRLRSVLTTVAARKPVILNKTARTEAGQRQAASHTGAPAIDDSAFETFLRECGAVRTRHMSEFIDAALALASQPPLRGSRVGVLSVAGGLAVEMCDLLIEHGFSVPALDVSTQTRLRPLVPTFGTTANPVDVTGSMITEPSVFGDCLDALLRDPNVDVAVILLTAVGDPQFARVMHARMATSDKPVLVVWTAGRERTGDALDYLTQRRIPVYDSTIGIIHALCGLRAYWGERSSGRCTRSADSEQ